MENTIKGIIDNYEGDKGFLVPVLQDVQLKLNLLPREGLDFVSSYLDVPHSNIVEVAIVYIAFRLEPSGRCEMASC